MAVALDDLGGNGIHLKAQDVQGALFEFGFELGVGAHRVGDDVDVRVERRHVDVVDVVARGVVAGVVRLARRAAELRGLRLGLDALRTGERAGFGLAAVSERIVLYYGPGYGLKISSTEGEGTVMEVYMAKKINRDNNSR